VNEDQAESSDLDAQTIVSWYKQDLIDKETLLDLMQHIGSKGKGKASRVVDAEANPSPDEAKTRTVKDIQPDPTATAIVPNIPDKGPKAADISINVLCAAWNGGINTVSKIETEFKMSHREAYKAYKLIKAQRGEAVEEQE
jgi:hypothetical protein